MGRHASDEKTARSVQREAVCARIHGAPDGRHTKPLLPGAWGDSEPHALCGCARMNAATQRRHRSPGTLISRTNGYSTATGVTGTTAK
eukprot:1437695-Prymnesium_polylepis.1